MKESDAIRICIEIENKKMLKANEINFYLKSRKLTRSKPNIATILRVSVNRGASFSPIVPECILDCATKTDEFYRLVIELCHNTQIPECLEPLADLYTQDPETAMWLIQKLENADDHGVTRSLIPLYGGMGRREPTKFLAMINKRQSCVQKIACMHAIKFIYPNGNIPHNLVNYVVSLSRSCTLSVKQNAVHCMYNGFIKFQRVRKRLLYLATNADDDTRDVVSNIPISQINKHKKFALEILKLTVKSKNNANTIFKLSFCASEYPLECIKITRHLSKNVKSLAEFNLLLREIGQDDLTKIHGFMQLWIRNKQSSKTRKITLSDILSEIYQGHVAHLINLFGLADYKNKTTASLICFTFTKILKHTDAYSLKPFLEDIAEILLRIAGLHGMKTQASVDSNEPISKLLALIRTIGIIESTNIENIQDNIKQFPNLATTMKIQDFKRMIRGSFVHPLMLWLSMSHMPKLDPPRSRRITEYLNNRKSSTNVEYQKYRAHAMAANLESVLLSLKDELTPGIRHDLKGRAFFDTVAELTIAARLNQYDVQLRPKLEERELDIAACIGGPKSRRTGRACRRKRELDIAACIGGSKVLFEVFRPKEDQNAENTSYIYSTNKIRNRILEKAKQMKNVRGLDIPVVLVIDRTEAMGLVGVHLLHSFGLILPTHVNESKTILLHPISAENSIYKSSDVRLISAIMLVNQYFDHVDMKIKLDGSLFYARHPLSPLERKVGNAIEKAVFHTNLHHNSLE